MAEGERVSETVSPRRSPVLRLWERALDLIFPPRCVGCGRFGAFLCDECLAATPVAVPPRCDRCWVAMEAQGTCHRCRRGPSALAGARAAFVYGGPAREAVHALKFKGLSAIAPRMAREMARVLAGWAPPVPVVVPVPLAGSRRRLRGYNQSELLAREVAQRAGLPLCSQALARRRSTLPQARLADEEARRRNVHGAFTPRAVPPGAAILLVDDVMTTGATVEACARALRAGGSGPVYALLFARED